MSKVILLVGKMGCGKTTAANILKKYGFEEHIFADPIKKFASSIGFEDKELYGTLAEKETPNEFWGISGREFMQKFGTEVGRDYVPKVLPKMEMNDRTLWARVMEKKIRGGKSIVISDGRFGDEVDLVRDYRGVVIALTRDDVKESKHSQHASETSLNKINADYTIPNNGSLEELESNLVNILTLEFDYELPKPNKKRHYLTKKHMMVGLGLIGSLMCVRKLLK